MRMSVLVCLYLAGLWYPSGLVVETGRVPLSDPVNAPAPWQHCLQRLSDWPAVCLLFLSKEETRVKSQTEGESVLQMYFCRQQKTLADYLISERFVWFQQVVNFGGFTHLFPKWPAVGELQTHSENTSHGRIFFCVFLMCSSYLFQTPLLMDVLCILGYEVVQLLRDRHTVARGLRSSLCKRKIMLTKEAKHFPIMVFWCLEGSRIEHIQLICTVLILCFHTWQFLQALEWSFPQSPWTTVSPS